MTLGAAFAATLLSIGAWVLILVADLSSGCYMDDPCHSSPMTGLQSIGYGLVLGAIGVVVLTVIVAAAWGQPSPAVRWHALLALAMAPMPTVAVLVFLFLYLPAGGLLATVAAAGVGVAWLLAWTRLVRWSSNRVPISAS